MSTVDSTTYDVEHEFQSTLATARTVMEQRRVAEIERARLAKEQEHEKLMAEWAHPLDQIRVAVPEWARQYIKTPTMEYSVYRSEERRYGHVLIELPGCNPIAAWAFNGVVFEVATSRLGQDEDDGNWVKFDILAESRRSRWGMDYGEEDWAVTVAWAHDAYLNGLDLVAEAELRNQQRQQPAVTPAPTPKPVAIEMPFDPGGKVLAAIQELDFDLDTVYQRGVLYAFIMLAGELRHIREATEDIAAVMLASEPAQETK